MCVYMMLVALSMCLRVGAGSMRKTSVPMIAILLSSSVGVSIRVTDWCVMGPGFAPRRVQL